MQFENRDHLHALRGTDIRTRNEKLVLYEIFRADGISQPEIAQRTGLRPPTVLRIFGKLIDRGLITRCGKQRNSPDRRGRRPTFYCTNPDAHYCIGIDFWSESAHAGVINFQGSVLHTMSETFRQKRTADYVLDTLAALAERSIDELGLTRDRILGVGVGAPGRVDVERGQVLYYTGVEDMIDFEIRDELERRIELPTVIHNTCSVIASSQYRYGVAAHAKSLCVVTMRSGVGASLVTGGKVFLNQNKTNLEVGHMSLNVDEEPWASGDTGRLEREVSESAIIEALSAVVPVRTMADVDALIQGGSPEVEKVLAEKGRIVALLVWNLFQLMGPEIFIIITRSPRLSEYFARRAEAALLQDPFVRRSSVVRVLGVEYDPLIACRGAADLVLDSYFADERMD